MTQQWFAIQTKPKAEIFVEHRLQQAGFTSFCPKFVKTYERLFRGEKKIYAWFPRYLFVQLDRDTQEWRLIGKLNGVTKILGYREDGYICPVKPGAVEVLIANSENGFMAESVLQDIKQFAVGEQVRIIEGSLQGGVGKILRSERKRVEILYVILGRQSKISLPTSAVEKV